MRILLDTNIIIHREASRVSIKEIGVLFKWLDKLHYEKCIHPLSLDEIRKHKNSSVVETIKVKIKNYNLLKTEAPEVPEIQKLRASYDHNENDKIDTSLLKEVFCDRVDFLITEDRNIHAKANRLGIAERVFTIDDFLEKATAENPDLSDYKILSVKKEYFGNLNLNDPFFDSFKEDYKGFGKWFNRKSDEVAYVCQSEGGNLLAFLYVKIEAKDENYRDIEPTFAQKRRLKVGTFKVISNGYKLGERFLKIIFDNSLANNVDEIYLTIFDKSEEHERLIGLIKDWGFEYHGVKTSQSGVEKVYVKNFKPLPDEKNPKRTYPFISKKRRYFIVPIYPEYHTELFPDSILKTESEQDYVENEPHRNAIQKVYICRSVFRELIPGDILLFYRTGGYYKGVMTTIGVVDSVITKINGEIEFIRLCRKRSVFNDDGLKEFWNYNKSNRPFIANFLYLYSLPKRPNLKALIDLGVIKDISSAPRGFEQISFDKFETILKESESNESFIVN
ncbi:MAG: PIN domain-containing protein [Thermodesulfobacteriota bacterium]